MAVIQISKIQIRRGLKNSGIGVPQLSSAEMAWAVDTQELFIGNGSIADGAPYVGNTKILTEHDNILELIESYRFANDDVSIIYSEPRPLQKKLDEYVSIFDFVPEGITADGNTDFVNYFENAFTDLFRNSNDNFKKILKVPNGIYLFSRNLQIPANAIIEGENNLRSILKIENNNVLFITEDGDEIADFNSTNRPTNIKISNLTVQSTTGSVVITGIADSEFESVKFVSDYELNDPVGNLTSAPSLVSWENSLAGIATTGIKFKNCIFDSAAIGARCDQLVVDSTDPPVFTTKINFESCVFSNCDTGIFLSTDPILISQINDWQINDCTFNEIANRAIYTTGPGRGTLVQRSIFRICGNGIDLANNPKIEVVSFGDNFGNIVKDCSFDRHQSAAIEIVDNTVVSFPEVRGGSNVSIIDRNYADIDTVDFFKPLAVFSSLNRYITIDYNIQLGTHNRAGQLNIVVDETQTNATISDNYFYSAPTITSPGGPLMISFEFSVSLRDNDLDSVFETLVLSYKNPIGTGETGTIAYSVSYGV